MRESNPLCHLGKVACDHYTNTAKTSGLVPSGRDLNPLPGYSFAP